MRTLLPYHHLYRYLGPFLPPAYRDRGRQPLPITSSLRSTNDTERKDELRRAVHRVLQIVGVDDAQATRHANQESGEVLDNALPGPSSSSCVTQSRSWDRFSQAYKDVVSSIRGAKHQDSIFKRKGCDSSISSKKRKVSSWTQNFMCLAEKDSERVPTTVMKREALALGGLGLKHITIPNVDCTTEEFHELLYQNFPKLRNAGGFELMRCIPCTRDLEVIPSPFCHSPRLLRSRLGSSRIYIRPIQANIDIELSIDEHPAVTEVCLKCTKRIPFNELRKHVAGCKGLQVVDNDVDDSSDIDSSPSYSPLYSEHNSPSQIDTEACGNDIAVTEEVMVDYAVEISASGSEVQSHNVIAPITDTQSKVFQNVTEIAEHLQGLTSTDEQEIYFLAVRRSDVLSSALCGIDRRTFSPNKLLEISFLGEEAQDGGGPKREFFRLLATTIKDTMCVGRNGSYVFRHDMYGIQTNKFLKIGMLLVMSVAQGGGGYPFFAKCVFDYLCGDDISKLEVDIGTVGDEEAYTLLQKIEMEQDSKSLQQVLMESFDIIANAGYTKPIPSVSTQDKKDIQRAIALQYTILQCITELEQFKHGLSSMHFLDIVKANREVAAPFFMKRNEKLTADKIQDLLKNIMFTTDPGTNTRSREEEVYIYFVRLLNECEESTDPDHLTLADILIFFSGVDSIPPLGFSFSPTLTFHNKGFPSSSTCALTLTLPIHSDYVSFKAKVTFGMKHHGGFGKP